MPRSGQVQCGSAFHVQQENQTRPRFGRILCGASFCIHHLDRFAVETFFMSNKRTYAKIWTGSLWKHISCPVQTRPKFGRILCGASYCVHHLDRLTVEAPFMSKKVTNQGQDLHRFTVEAHFMSIKRANLDQDLDRFTVETFHVQQEIC